MRHRPTVAATALLLVASFGASACAGSDDPGDVSEPESLLTFPDAEPGQIVGLVAVEGDDGPVAVEWLDRLEGTVHRLELADDAEPEVVATIPVGTDDDQRGLLGQVVLDGRRFAAWTQPDTYEFVVGEIVDGAPGPIVFSAGEASGGAVGGVLREIDGDILLGLGRNTGFDRESGIGGTMLVIDPDGTVDTEPRVVSEGYTNPWAFAVVDDTEIWVADNAAGEDPATGQEDIERIGRADLLEDRADMTRIVEEGRAPTAMIELTDGRLGICGFLDDELRAYEVVDGEDADPTNPATIDVPRSELRRAGSIMPCLTAATIFDDGTIVTVAITDVGQELLIRRS